MCLNGWGCLFSPCASLRVFYSPHPKEKLFLRERTLKDFDVRKYYVESHCIELMTWVAKQNMHTECIDAEEVCTLKYSIKILKREAKR